MVLLATGENWFGAIKLQRSLHYIFCLSYKSFINSPPTPVNWNNPALMKNVKSKRKVILQSLGAAICLGIVTVLILGKSLCAPCPQIIGALPPDLVGEAIAFQSASGSNLKGWLLPGKKRGAVILMHGIRGNRTTMLGRARFLNEAGYSVFLFDFQAHGESEGPHITFGYQESKDARAAVDFVKAKLPGEKIAVLGSSLGGAAALLAHPRLKVDAMILEMVYPTLEQAIEDRLFIRLSKIGPFFAPLLVWQIKPRLGFVPEDLCPIREVSQITVPKFFIAGTKDRHTTLAESQRLFDAAAQPKEFWAVQGAGHVNFHDFAKGEYERRVLKFLKENLN